MKQIRIALLMMLIMTLLLGVMYPLMMTGIAQLAFSNKANGSLAMVDGRTVGSELLGQSFTGPGYFHGRPSANSYDGANSGGSNLGPTNRKLIETSVMRADQVRKENGLAPGTMVPSDLVLASGSGLDPHVSLASALIQVPRIARERNIGEPEITDLVRHSSELPYFGAYGDPIVNIFRLNIALDALGKKK